MAYIFAVWGIFIVEAIDPQSQALIDANSEALDRLRTVQVHYETVAKTDPVGSRPCETWWSREGRRERIRRIGGHLDPTSDGRPRDINELVIDGDSYKWLRNWDPENPQQITPTRQGTVRARIGPQTSVNAFLVAPSFELLLEVDLMPRRTLRELAKASSSVACKGKVQVDGRELWLLSLAASDDATDTLGPRSYDVYLDPNAGFMIRRLVMRAPKLTGDGNATVFVHEAVDFEEFGDGVYFPKTFRHGTPEKWLSDTVVTSIKLNEPIPPETFEMHWPKYVAITHLPAVNGKYKVEIWGEDMPLQEITSMADLKKIEKELRKDPVVAAELGPEMGARPPLGMSTMLKLTIGLAALVVVMVGLIIVRRVREQAA